MKVFTNNNSRFVMKANSVIKSNILKDFRRIQI